jgi:hypothetical protein
MVEAGGQLIRSFRYGLDYAFMRAGHPASMRSVLSGGSFPLPKPDPSTRPEPQAFFGEPMSLYRAGLKLALFLPLGVAMPPSQRRRRQVSPM